MANRAPETIRVTYAPAGVEPVFVDIERTRHSDNASRREGRAIAEAMMLLRPGVNAFDKSDFRVDRVHDGSDRTLYHWEDRARAPFERAAHGLTHGNPLHVSELHDLREVASAEGTEMQRRNRKRRHADPFFVPGRLRAKFVAWNPIFSTNSTERLAAAGANLLLRDVDVKVSKIGVGPLAVPLSHPIKHTFHLDNPYIIPGLGKDNRDMVHELGPDKSIAHMQDYLSGLLRRFQDRELDPADIVHGIGKAIVDIVEKHQSGLSGVFLTLTQAELPLVREAIEAVFNVESLSSADKGASKFALLTYSTADGKALERRMAKRKDDQPTHEEILQDDPSLGQRTLSHVEEMLKAQFDWSPSAIRRRVRDSITAVRHRLVWYPANVYADQLDRRSERQDEVAMAYVHTVLNAEGGSDAFKSYQKALATAFARALTAPRTETEKSMRKLSGESSSFEQKIEDELMSKIPPYWQDVIRKGLAALAGKKANLPEAYRTSLKGLKAHEEEDSYLDYMRELYPLAVQYSTNDESNPLAGKGKQLRLLREQWRQAREYTEYVDGIRAAAHHILVPGASTGSADQVVTTLEA